MALRNVGEDVIDGFGEGLLALVTEKETQTCLVEERGVVEGLVVACGVFDALGIGGETSA